MDETLSLAPDRSKPAVVVGGIAAVLPFFASASSSTTVNGQLVSYRDNIALGGGVVAIIAGIVAAIAARSSKNQAMLIGGLVVLAVGVFQVLRGLGKT